MPVSVNIFNVSGQKVYFETFAGNGQNILTIDAADFVEGLYIIELRTDKMVSHTKLIIR